MNIRRAGTPMTGRRRLAALATALAALGAVSTSALSAELLSHRAAYRLSLGTGATPSTLSSVSGTLVLEWRADCSGSTSQQRLGFIASPSEGPSFSYDVRFSGWERAGGGEFRFAMRSFQDGHLADEVLGRASGVAGQGGEVRYDRPQGEQHELPDGVLFPTAHIEKLIAAAQAGEKVLTSAVFDGSGPFAVSRVTAVIGTGRDEGGGSHRSWPVSLAYFDPAATSDVPELEIEFKLRDDGVLERVHMDYGDFALEAELAELTPLERLTCP